MTSQTFTRADGSTITLTAKEIRMVQDGARQLGVTFESLIEGLRREKRSYGGRV